MEDRPCINRPQYKEVSPGQWKGNVLDRVGVTARSFRCVSVQGFASILIPELLGKPPHLRWVQDVQLCTPAKGHP